MRKRLILRMIGVLGTVACMVLFLAAPSWPTPDKLLVFMTFIFMIFNQAAAMLKRLAPFVALILVYESFRGLVPHLNTQVNYLWMPAVDRQMFGSLPTAVLQQWWWNGHVQWYDFVFYMAYMLHFILPFALAIAIWKLRETQYWRYVTAFIGVSFAGFLTFLLFPAAPPWMASDMRLIEPITRISSDVWAALGIHDFPSVYNRISPNPVAAVPSLHAAYATLFALFVTSLFKTRWRFVAWLYPLLIYLGTVYQGEHYVIDELLGALYAFAAFMVSPYVVKGLRAGWLATQKLAAQLQRRVLVLKPGHGTIREL